MGATRIQIVVPEELCEVLDEHVARLRALYPALNVTRSALARQWLEEALPEMERRLRSEEAQVRKARKTVPILPKPLPFPDSAKRVFPVLKRGRPKKT